MDNDINRYRRPLSQAPLTLAGPHLPLHLAALLRQHLSLTSSASLKGQPPPPSRRLSRLTLSCSLLLCMSALSLASCVRVYDYPSDWAPRVESTAQGGCPDLTGMYQKMVSGTVSGTGEFRGRAFLSLIDQLFYEGGLVNPWAQDFPDGSRNLEQLVATATSVGLTHPTPQTLEITVWTGQGKERFVLRRETLSSAKGDFSCDADGLHLATRHRYFAVLLENSFSMLDKTLLKATDGSLLIKFEMRIMGNWRIFFPYAAKQAGWFRWEPYREYEP